VSRPWAPPSPGRVGKNLVKKRQPSGFFWLFLGFLGFFGFFGFFSYLFTENLFQREKFVLFS
jgi:hypothetical protein